MLQLVGEKENGRFFSMVQLNGFVELNDNYVRKRQLPDSNVGPQLPLSHMQFFISKGITVGCVDVADVIANALRYAIA